MTVKVNERLWSIGKRKVSVKTWSGWFKKSSVGLVKRLLNKGELNLVHVLTPASPASTPLTYGSTHTHTSPPHPNSHIHKHVHTLIHMYTHKHDLLGVEPW